MPSATSSLEEQVREAVKQMNAGEACVISGVVYARGKRSPSGSDMYQLKFTRTGIPVFEPCQEPSSGILQLKLKNPELVGTTTDTTQAAHVTQGVQLGQAAWAGQE